MRGRSNGLMNWIDHSEGLVFRESGTITRQERDIIIEWITGQRFSGSLVVGEVEDHDHSTVVGTIDGEHYEIDNATPLQSD